MSGPAFLVEALIGALLVLGGGFALIGSWALVRLPTLMERLHGPTKATTLGLGAILVASMLLFSVARGAWSTHELLISLFLFITAPISANLIAKLHLHRLRTDPAEIASPAGPPPAPPGGSKWATYEEPRPGSPACTTDQ